MILSDFALHSLQCRRRRNRPHGERCRTPLPGCGENPFLATYSLPFFFRAGFNFADLIFNGFIHAHQSLLLAATISVYLLLSEVGIYLVFCTSLVVPYYASACRQFFHVILMTVAVRAVLVTVSGYPVFRVLIGFTIRLVVPAIR
jgi:hypothetical protein